MDDGGENVHIKQAKKATYSEAVGLMYIFNLIVGTGALTMPKAFQEAGYVLGVVTVTALAFVSYITTTFVIEAMSCANALRRLPKDDVDSFNPRIWHNTIKTFRTFNGERTTSLFDITETAEMGQMAEMFFNTAGRFVFYLCIIIYLFGDLAIYAAAVPKTLRDVSCTYIAEVIPINSTNTTTCNVTLKDSDPCWSSAPTLTRADVYRIYVAGFFLLLGPFTFFNLQKTTLMQISTTLLRWLAFSMMISLTLIRLFKGEGEGHPPAAVPSQLPTLFGVCVYSFMCHHSLPQMATPIRNKSRLYRLLAADYTLILVFYAALCFTATFAFAELQDLYTLNFRVVPCQGAEPHPITQFAFLRYFISLFPVFSISSSFPIIAITLRGNLSVLITSIRGAWGRRGRGEEGLEDETSALIKKDTPTKNSWVVERILLPTVTLLIPLGIAMGTNNLSGLVGITGSYAGAAIQYFIPACFVLLGRRKLYQAFGEMNQSDLVTEAGRSDLDRSEPGHSYLDTYNPGHRDLYTDEIVVNNRDIAGSGNRDVVVAGSGNPGITKQELLARNEFTSPFSHTGWVVFVFVWAVACVALVTANHIIQRE